jgi:hypothetical protein
VGFEKEKRKNGERQRGFLPIWAWTLVIGFMLGIAFSVLLLMPSNVETVYYPSGDSLTVNDQAIYATATYIVEQATATQAAIDAAKP